MSRAIVRYVERLHRRLAQIEKPYHTGSGAEGARSYWKGCISVSAHHPIVPQSVGTNGRAPCGGEAGRGDAPKGRRMSFWLAWGEMAQASRSAAVCSFQGLTGQAFCPPDSLLRGPARIRIPKTIPSLQIAE